MVELRAVGPEFPLYGSLTLRDGAYSHSRLSGRGALVRPELLAQFGLSEGDRIQVGSATFEISGVITAEPGRRLGAFTLGPRVIIDRADLDATGLLRFGSRASYQQLLRVPEAVAEQVVFELRQTFADEFVDVRWYGRTEDQMGENLTRAENYLSLVGLVVLILGGIGVSSVTRVFVQQKVRSIAILKCVGSSSGQMLAIYMTQVLLLGLAGSVLGVSLAAAGAGRGSGVRRRPHQRHAGRIRADLVGCPAGTRDRNAGVDAVLARAAARSATRQAVAAAAAGRSTAGEVRLAEVDGDCRRRRCPGCGRVVAGRIRGGGLMLSRRLRGRVASCCTWQGPGWSAPFSRCGTRAPSRFDRRCCTSHGPATRRA